MANEPNPEAQNSLSDADISKAKNRAALGASGKSPYTHVFNSENPALETVEKDHFFKALAANELGINNRSQDFLGLKLPEGLSDESQAVYDRQVEMCKKLYETTQTHLQASAFNRAEIAK